MQGQGGTQVHRLGGVVLGPVLAPPPGLRARGPAAAGHGAQGAVWGARARPAPAFGRGQVLRLGGRPRGVAAAPPPGRGRIELLVEEHGQLLVIQPRGRRGGEVPRRAPRGLRGALRLGAHPWGALGRGGPALLPGRLGRGVRREPPPRRRAWRRRRPGRAASAGAGSWGSPRRAPPRPSPSSLPGGAWASARAREEALLCDGSACRAAAAREARAASSASASASSARLFSAWAKRASPRS